MYVYINIIVQKIKQNSRILTFPLMQRGNTVTQIVIF